MQNSGLEIVAGLTRPLKVLDTTLYMYSRVLGRHLVVCVHKILEPIF